MSITTSGAGADGVFVQSLGGGGGAFANLDGSAIPIVSNAAVRRQSVGQGGAVSIDLRGSVVASGANAYGIFVQSGVQKSDGSLDPARPGGPVQIDFTGMLQGGSGLGAAIRIDGGAANTISIGAGSTVSALSGTALLGTFGQETVVNRGTVTGDVNLAAGGTAELNRFFNEPGALYRTGPAGIVNLGNGAFHNHGTVDIGGVGTVATATVTGRFVQGPEGRLLVDVGTAPGTNLPVNDVLVVSKDASLGGAVQVNILNGLLPANYTVVTAASGIVGTPGVLGSATLGVVPINWTSSQTATALSVTPVADFANPRGTTLSSDQRSVATEVQRAWTTKSAAQSALFPQLLAITSPTAYAAALDTLDQEAIQYQTASRVQDTQTTLRAAMSCPAFETESVLLREGSCVWSRVAGTGTSLASSSDESGYHASSVSVRTGMQKELPEDWFVGLTAAYTAGWLRETTGLAEAESHSVDAAVAVKRQIGPWLVAASATVGHAGLDSVRRIYAGNLSAVAKSKSEIWSLGGKLRGSYQIQFPTWYVKPTLDLDAIHISSPAYQENGAPGVGLSVASSRKWLFGVSPGIEIGRRFNVSPTAWARVYAAVGATFLSSGHYTGSASLLGDVAIGNRFSTSSRIPDRLADFLAGAQVGYSHGVEFALEYESHVAAGFLSQTGSGRLTYRF